MCKQVEKQTSNGPEVQCIDNVKFSQNYNTSLKMLNAKISITALEKNKLCINDYFLYVSFKLKVFSKKLHTANQLVVSECQLVITYKSRRHVRKRRFAFQMQFKLHLRLTGGNATRFEGKFESNCGEKEILGWNLCVSLC